MALTTHGLSRRFGDFLAADDVSFSVERGRLTGFVGANGAGKTTVMRMILGVLEPSAGTVSLDGKQLDQVTRRSFGYMPEERGLYPKMPLREQMIYFGELHGMSKQDAAASADLLLDTLSLQERAKDPVENLSLGNQQRAQIAVSLVHQPTALILDEPFSGLDPMAVDVILAVLAEHAERGIPILLSSHQLDLVERLCDDLVIISKGRVVASGSIDGLRKEHAKDQFTLTADQDLGWLVGFPGVRSVEPLAPGLSGQVTLSLDGDQETREATVRRLVGEASSRGPIASFGQVATPLSEIFRDVVEETGQSDAPSIPDLEAAK